MHFRELQALEQSLEGHLKEVRLELERKCLADRHQALCEFIPDFDEQVNSSYKEGLETGQVWKDAYMPGGPWVPSRPTLLNPVDMTVARYELLRAKADNWKLGFIIGAPLEFKEKMGLKR